MKKENKYAALIKKVAVASVSLIASGAIIFGLIKHNEKKDVNVSKNTVATESSQYNNNAEKEENYVGDDYVKVFDGSHYLADWRKDSYPETAVERAEYGGIIYEAESTIYGYNIPEGDEKEYRWLAIKGKNDEKFTEIKDFKFWNLEDVYSNGKYIISAYEKCIYKYDIATKKLEVIDAFNDKNLKEYKDDNAQISNIITIRNYIVYMYIFTESKPFIADLGSYNINNGEVKIEKEKVYIAIDEASYDYLLVYYKDSKVNNVLSLFSYTSDGLGEEKKIRENVMYLYQNALLESGKIPYICDIVGKKSEIENKYDNFEKFTMYFYDIQSGEEKKIVELDIENLGESEVENMEIREVFDDYCEIFVNFKNHSYKRLKYIYATKKIEEL